MTVNSDEYVGGRGERGWQVSASGVGVGLRVRSMLADVRSKTAEIRRVWCGWEKLGWNYERISVYHFLCGNICTVLRGSAEAEEDPGQVGHPRCVSATGDEGSLQGSVHTFDKAVGFRIVCCGQVM